MVNFVVSLLEQLFFVQKDILVASILGCCQIFPILLLTVFTDYNILISVEFELVLLGRLVKLEHY